MSTILEWAAIERNFIREDLMWLKAGAKVISPSGDDITAKRIADLSARLEHADQMVGAHVKK